MSEAIHILFGSWYTGLGGGETALLTLAEHLDPAQFVPHLLLPAEGQLSERWRAHGWPVHSTGYRGASTWFIPAVWERFPVVRRIEQIIRKHEIRVVHSDYHTLPYLLPAAERAGVPAVWTCMGWWFRPKPWQRGFFRRPAAAFAHSRAIQEGFQGRPVSFMPVDAMQVLYPGVDTQRFHPDTDRIRVRFEAGIRQDAPVVAMVARFQSVKGHEAFQQMARQVALQIPEARFMVAGENVHGVSADETYKQRILAAVEGDGLLRERLVYLGFRTDVERVMAAADVVVCCSQFESFGVAVVEAMACARPVVNMATGGPWETITHTENGFNVGQGDTAEMARWVITLLRDPQRRAEMGTAGRRRAERLFSAKATAEVFARTVMGVVGDTVR